MRYEFGDMWQAYADPNSMFCITTNSTIKGNGELVMGRGIALQTKRYISVAPLQLGKIIRNNGFELKVYGLIVIRLRHDFYFGAFQVKTLFRHQADVDIIRNSTNRLNEWCKTHNDIEINLNYPGIGNGKLPISIVEPIISILPDNVRIWRFE